MGSDVGQVIKFDWVSNNVLITSLYLFLSVIVGSLCVTLYILCDVILCDTILSCIVSAVIIGLAMVVTFMIGD